MKTGWLDFLRIPARKTLGKRSVSAEIDRSAGELSIALVDLLRLYRDKPPETPRLLAMHKALDLALQRANFPIEVNDFLALSAALSLSFWMAAINTSLPELAIAGGCTAAALTPLAITILVGKRRQAKFLEQLTVAIDILRASLLIGHGITAAVKAVSEQMPEPCATEFREIVQRVRLGENLSRAMAPTLQKFPTFELEFIRCAIDIHHETGGSMAHLLERANYTLRERLKLKEKLAAITAHSQLTAIILAALPVVLVAGFSLFHSQYLWPLFNTTEGRQLLGLACIMHATGVAAAFWLSQPREL